MFCQLTRRHILFCSYCKEGAAGASPVLKHSQAASLSRLRLQKRRSTMKDTTETAGKLMPPAFNKQTVTGTKEPKQKTSPEQMAFSFPSSDQSPPRKKKTQTEAASFDLANAFEATAAGASREVTLLLAKFAEVLSDRAVADTAQMKELEGILTEARNLESFLKEKKNHLRQTLALISDKLQG